jgi:glutamate formiminotransferase/formiminotetrahydrofolate cyclodeaminase
MPSYSSMTLGDLLDAFAATSPAPGGGSAAALAGSLGVSLLLMAIGIRTSRPSGSPESFELADAANQLRSLRPTIASLVDRDAEAYSSVLTARRTKAPAGAVEGEAPMRVATEVPLETMRVCRRALLEAQVVAAHAIRSTHSDVGVAVELLRAAVRAAGITVDANLASLRDADYVGLVKAERQKLDAESAADADNVVAYLQGRSG